MTTPRHIYSTVALIVIVNCTVYTFCDIHKFAIKNITNQPFFIFHLTGLRHCFVGIVKKKFENKLRFRDILVNKLIQLIFTYSLRCIQPLIILYLRTCCVLSYFSVSVYHVEGGGGGGEGGHPLYLVGKREPRL